MGEPEHYSRIFRTIAYNIPFSPFRGVVWHVLNKAGRSVLDVGCGKGALIRVLGTRSPRMIGVGVEMFMPYLRYGKTSDLYDSLVRADVRNLPFSPKSFDVVVCLEVIEHLEREEGIRLIGELEKIARMQVVISTPSQFEAQLNLDGNDFQRHRSEWHEIDFSARGYVVRGQILKHLPRLYELSFVFPLLSLIAFFNPSKSRNLLATKDLAGATK